MGCLILIYFFFIFTLSSEEKNITTRKKQTTLLLDQVFSEFCGVPDTPTVQMTGRQGRNSACLVDCLDLLEYLICAKRILIYLKYKWAFFFPQRIIRQFKEIKKTMPQASHNGNGKQEKNQCKALRDADARCTTYSHL